MASTVWFDPSLPDFLDNPYPIYQQLRETDPVHWEPAPASRWVLRRYADVTAALRDPRLAKAGAEPLLNDVPPAVRADVAWLERSVDDQIDSINPPKHTRLRRLLNAASRPSSSRGGSRGSNRWSTSCSMRSWRGARWTSSPTSPFRYRLS